MKNSKNKKEIIEASNITIKEDENLITPQILRSEFNFLKYPFFDLTKTSSRDKIEIREEGENSEGEKVEILWKVTRPIDYSFPSAFDKKLDKVIEQVLNKLPKPIKNPIRLGSLRYICKLMNISSNSGKNIDSIKNALEKMVLTGIQSKGTFYLKDGKKYIDDTFHKYDRVILMGQKLLDGTEADAVYVVLGSWYLQNINDNYVVPLDHKYYLSLEGTITIRMYEFLSLMFFPAIQRNQKYIDIKYSQHCMYFPLVKQDKLWKARKQISEAHNKLGIDKNTQNNLKFISKVEWRNLKGPEEWTIRYYIGDRARNEYARFHRKQLPYQNNIPLIEETSEKISLTNELIKRGVTNSTAEDLYQKYPDRIKKQINYFDFLVKKHNEKVSKNPAGFLRSSIEKNFNAPQGYITLEERERQKKLKEELEKRHEWQGKVEQYQSLKNMSPEKQVQGSILIWQREYKKKNGDSPSLKEIKAKEKELINELPSDKELQIQIFGRVVYEEKTGDLFQKSEERV